MQLTRQDFDVLCEAIERWEQDDSGSEVVGIMMQTFLSDMNPVAAKSISDKMSEEKRKRDDARRQRKERGVMLRAKLITMRDAIEAQEFVDQAAKRDVS